MQSSKDDPNDPIWVNERRTEEELRNLLADQNLAKRYIEFLFQGQEHMDKVVKSVNENDPGSIYYVLGRSMETLRMKLGTELTSTERTQHAIEYYKKASDHGTICYGDLAACYETIGEYTKAEEIYQALLNDSRIPGYKCHARLDLAKRNLGLVKWHKKDIPEAIAHLKEAIKLLESGQM